MKQVHKGLFCVILSCMLLVSSLISGRSVLPAFADETTYTGVLKDLQKDSEFNVNDYPEKSDDYSVSVIQIAESTGGELFVYTYEPARTVVLATKINMSLVSDFDEDAITETVDSAGNAVQVASVTRDIGDGVGGFIGGVLGDGSTSENTVKTQLYLLQLLNSNGVFCKYLVRDFSVSAEMIRYYNITSIYREWLKGIDAETGNDNTKNSVAFPVGKCFTATTENGSVSYSCEKRKVIKVINPVAGYLRYADGFILKYTACDSHYVAFTTDMRVDELYEADLSYRVRSVHYYHKAFVGGVTDYGEWVPRYAFLTDEQKFIKERTGWLKGESAEYNRIQSVKEFIEKEKLPDSAKEKLRGRDWVLRFVETDCTFIYDGSDQGNNYWSEVSEVTVLRLKFKSSGKVYNLGAVSDEVTEGRKPDNVPDKVGFWQFVWNCIVKLFKGTATLFERFVAVVAIIIVVMVLSLLLLVLSLIFPAFGAVMKTILKGLWWFICLPFRGIAALVGKMKKE